MVRISVFLVPFLTLCCVCEIWLILCVAALEYVGPIPYDILKPVLECCTPTQLYYLEDFNPVSLTHCNFIRLLLNKNISRLISGGQLMMIICVVVTIVYKEAWLFVVFIAWIENEIAVQYLFDSTCLETQMNCGRCTAREIFVDLIWKILTVGVNSTWWVQARFWDSRAIHCILGVVGWDQYRNGTRMHFIVLDWINPSIHKITMMHAIFLYWLLVLLFEVDNTMNDSPSDCLKHGTRSAASTIF